MAFKYFAILALVAVSNAGFIGNPHFNQHPEPQHQIYNSLPPHHGHTKSLHEYDPHPQYKFSYSVDDQHTGDSKSQYEERDGDVVRGEYSLIDADGYKRTVKYTADSIHGFNAVVHREPLSKIFHTSPILVKSHLTAPARAINSYDHYSGAAPFRHH